MIIILTIIYSCGQRLCFVTFREFHYCTTNSLSFVEPLYVCHSGFSFCIATHSLACIFLTVRPSVYHSVLFGLSCLVMFQLSEPCFKWNSAFCYNVYTNLCSSLGVLFYFSSTKLITHDQANWHNSSASTLYAEVSQFTS
jgi:hypothetical protein